MAGKLVIFSAPSGAGKTTIVKQVLKSGLPLEFSISATSRNSRNGEVHGKDYYFLTAEDFKSRIENNEFVEWQEVYPGSFYGTLKTELDRIWEKQKHVLFDVDVLGGLNLKKMFSMNALALFVMPPSLEVLEQRLRGRNTDPEEKIKERIAKAQYELSFASQFDKVIVNDDLDKAVSETIQMITSFIHG